MSLLGEEGLNEVWERMKAKILEENQKYRLNLEDGAYSLKNLSANEYLYHSHSSTQ